MFNSMFPNEEPIDDFKRSKGIGWNSISQIFEGDNGRETLRWFATYYGFKSNIIAISLSAPKESFDKYLEVYKEIEKSIVFNY